MHHNTKAVSFCPAHRLLLALLAPALLLTGCQQEASTPEGPELPEPVLAETLKLTFTGAPEGFEVEQNDTVLSFVPTKAKETGRMTVEGGRAFGLRTRPSRGQPRLQGLV